MSEPLPDGVTLQPIKDILFTGDSDAKAIALVLSDGSGETRAYAIDPATLRAFLPPLLSLAAAWSGDPDFSFEGLGGTQNALVAKHILIARGRDDAESAVRVFLGKDVDLTFLMPRAALFAAFRAFAEHNPAFRQPQPPN